jgi:hypothetical protein
VRPGLAGQIAYYKAWREQATAPRPLSDDHDPYRCPVCNAQMRRDPWRCLQHGEVKPRYVVEPYSTNMYRSIVEEEKQWPEPNFEELLDELLAEFVV